MIIPHDNFIFCGNLKPKWVNDEKRRLFCRILPRGLQGQGYRKVQSFYFKISSPVCLGLVADSAAHACFTVGCVYWVK